MDRKPRIFLGSSTEGQTALDALLQSLGPEVEPKPWTASTFALAAGTLESLEEKLDGVDFAVLLLTADDVRDHRGRHGFVPRDNVVFEAGLCMGRLGRGRTFLVHDSAVSLGLPSDLAGITTATYAAHSDGDLVSPMTVPAARIRDAARRLGLREASDLARKLDAVHASVNAAGETGPEEHAYYDKLGQLVEAVGPSGLSLLYADVDGLRAMTRRVFVGERERRDVAGRALGRRPEAEIREEFLSALSIALADAVYTVRPAGLKHDVFRLPDPDVVLVAREGSYDVAHKIAEAALDSFRDELRHLWPGASERDPGLTLLVANLSRARGLVERGELPSMHQALRKRLKALKDDRGRGRVYGHDVLFDPGS